MDQCAAALTIRTVNDAAVVRSSFPLMAQLRPELADAAAWVSYWQRQSERGYRLAGLYVEDELKALAGYRIQENLVHGQFMYLDDLVTDVGARGQGHGEALVGFLRAEAERLGCNKLVLDTPLSNQLGHRFYFRCGLLATSLRFVEPIASAVARQ
ncbi:GNAT family N-acetyltransferase [Rhodoferax sp. GW822-FHT02A01]|uniref:GNAT family N-acetyltransferase n=1 Tax=Rhodoferax sp. GW822-FHT02A01 TaxID=3141537 RepID=UPI00315CE748